jgi:dethiobiotin synthetase
VAAERSPRPGAWRKTLAQFHRFEGSGVVEGAGGLLVPLDASHQVIDLAEELKLPVVLVARAGLGTLNHVGLSLEALHARRLKVAAVVLSRSNAEGDPSEADNPRWIRKLGVEVLGPVAHLSDQKRRHAAFERAVAPLVS